MTKERKPSPAWYIAATHYLTAGFVVPFIAGLLVGFMLFHTGLTGLPAQIILLAVSLAATWLGVIYSSKYLEKAYVIPDPERVVRLATIYHVVIYLLSMAGLFFTAKDVVDWQSTILHSIAWLLSIILFYLISKKYVKATSATPV